MTRDIRERLELFTDGKVKLERLALNMDQVRQYNPPPNPAKTTDSRFAGYIAEFGEESWELDALEPRVIVELIRSSVLEIRDGLQWELDVADEEDAKGQLSAVSSRWDDVTSYLEAS